MTATTQRADNQANLFTGFPVRIEVFEGPLDLLLQLVRRQEVEISEIPLATITEEYLKYLGTLQVLQIEPAGEFLVVAANLVWLKSRHLLPRPVDETEAELVEEEFIQSQEELQRKLEEYRAYKEAAGILNESRQMRQRVFLRSLSDDDEIGSGYVPLSDVSLFDMVSALQEMLQRVKEPPSAVIRPAEVTVGDCIQDILLRLRAAPECCCSFVDLVNLPTTRIVVVLTFLATLELIRRRQIAVSQGSEARQILVTLVT